jgi:hypothetical protein
VDRAKARRLFANRRGALRPGRGQNGAMNLNQIAGILPAVVFPTATLLQLLRIWRQRSTAGVNVSTWVLFGLANVAIYFYTERYAEWQAIIGMLLTAVLDFAIVAVVLWPAWLRPAPPPTLTVDGWRAMD